MMRLFYQIDEPINPFLIHNQPPASLTLKKNLEGEIFLISGFRSTMAKVPEAYLNSDFNEDDFDEYNPYPYKGGYDIVLTYGYPLPPSPAICYPIGGGEGAAKPVSSNKNTIVKIEESDYVPGNWNPARDSCGRCRDGASSWNITQWATDFLFGYLPVFSEKRDETQYSYSNLNYAYDRHTFQQPLTQYAENFVDYQPSTYNSNWCQNDNTPSYTVQVEPPWTWQGELMSYDEGGGGGEGGGLDYPLTENSYEPAEPAWYENIGNYDYGQEIYIDIVDSSLSSYAAAVEPSWSSPDVDFPYYEDNYDHQPPSYPPPSSQYVSACYYLLRFDIIGD